MTPQQSVKQLAKFSAYVLGRRPDEFGLVPDQNGYVKIKEFLKAVTEENDWRHLRRSHLDELLLTHPAPEIEIQSNRIRAISRTHLTAPATVDSPPKLLYTCIRRRAYPHVQQKGISAAGDEKIVLCVDEPMAQRIGKRRDPEPILLTVRVAQTLDHGVVYHRSGLRLYLADFIPAGTFTGPPLPKERSDSVKAAPTPERKVPTEAGSFVVDPTRFSPDNRKSGVPQKRREAEWKKERRRQRRLKDKW